MEKNIYGVQPAISLPSDYDESLHAAIQDLSRDSDRSVYEVIEHCNRVNIQRGNKLAWKMFGQEILSCAIERAFEEAEIPNKMVKQLIDDIIEDALDETISVTNFVEMLVEKVFQEIAERSSLEKETLNQSTENVISNIHSYLEVMEHKVEEENNSQFQSM